MIPVKQINNYSCSLACVESLAADKKLARGTQAEIIQDHPNLCSVGMLTPSGAKMDGAVALVDFFQLLRKMKLATRFEVGFGKSFIESHRADLTDGIFLHTTHHDNGAHGGYHVWRLENIQKDSFVVLEPDTKYQSAYKECPWDYLETRGCVAIVCVP